ncbi:MAG: ankyrin repeat domain-containing protein [Kiritimatiellae bacterium]|nr:ankyrin repeat domain-containing protein [Kiritimatiellia bacterium]
MIAGCEVPQRAAPPAVRDTLYNAAARGDIEGVRNLLVSGAKVNEPGAENATALHAAAYGGHVDVLNLLLEAGAQVNATDVAGFTPLHAAAREGKLLAARILVEHGANINALDESGLIPEQVARFMGKTDVANYLKSLAPSTAVAPPPDVPITEIDIPQVTLLTGANFRVWTSRAGAKIEAEFLQNILDSVTLRKRDGNLVRIALPQLSQEDQALVRQLTGLAAPIRARTRATAGVRGNRDSIGLKVGRAKGWDVLEDCRLLRRAGNDGDSFHVMHNGKEYIFRLYYVDTPEESMTYPDRVRDQARYFGISTEDTVRLGKEAARFTDRVLSRAPFTVVTQWTDARGNSRLPRNYAFVVTQDGDLDELLASEGLVRVYGMRIDNGYGNQKQRLLKQLENEAKRDQFGAWGIKKRTTAEAR